MFNFLNVNSSGFKSEYLRCQLKFKNTLGLKCPEEH